MKPLIAAALCAATLPALAVDAADPSAPVPAPVFTSPFPRQAMAAEAIAPAVSDWKAANAEVAAFPRGHTDLVRWEVDAARRDTGPSTPAHAVPPAPPAAVPDSAHHHHGGHR